MISASDYTPPQVPSFSSARDRAGARVGRNMSKEGVVMCWPIPRNMFATHADTLKPPLLLQILPTELRPHATITHIRLIPLGTMGGLVSVCTAAARTAVSCPTNVPSVEPLISLGALMPRGSVWADVRSYSYILSDPIPISQVKGVDLETHDECKASGNVVRFAERDPGGHGHL